MLDIQIKKLRTSCGITQVELANKLGVTKQCVSNWENDNIQPSIEMLIKIAKYFKVSADYILGIDNDKTIDVSNLTDKQIAHIRYIGRDLEELNQ